MGIGGVRMQDRFRFRVWNIKEKEMIYNAEIAYDGMNYNTEWKIGNNTNDGWVDCFGYYLDYEHEDYEIMQCTGLKDKNGKLIYEGDILGGTYGNLDIFYCPQCMQFELHCKDYGCMGCNGDVHWCEVVEDNNELEVIGNIYENPQLLED